MGTQCAMQCSGCESNAPDHVKPMVAKQRHRKVIAADIDAISVFPPDDFDKPRPAHVPGFASHISVLDILPDLEKTVTIDPSLPDYDENNPRLKFKTFRTLLSDPRQERQGSREPAPRPSFLSGVPEVNADFAYRFSFIVIGNSAGIVAASACSSDMALADPVDAESSDGSDVEDDASDAGLERSRNSYCRRGSASSGTSNPVSVSNSVSSNATSLRSLCSVPFQTDPLDNPKSMNSQVARLAFTCVNFDEGIPECSTRIEASATAAVFILDLDSYYSEQSHNGETSNMTGIESSTVAGTLAAAFDEQWEKFTEAIEIIRFRGKPECRPVVAMILCYGGEEEPQDEKVLWRARMEEYEFLNGPMWKFGPVSHDESDKLYCIFAEIASKRILKVKGGQCRNGDKNLGTQSRNTTEVSHHEEQSSATDWTKSYPVGAWATERHDDLRGRGQDAAPQKTKRRHSLSNTIKKVRLLLSRGGSKGSCDSRNNTSNGDQQQASNEQACHIP